MRLAHLSQELAELDPDQRVREAVEEIRLRIRVGDRELSAGQLLERLGFTAERQWTRVGDLSGGERRRVQMLRLLMGEPNVLLLDEPTNDLDIETLTEFEDLLDDWPGTLVVVSHDRYFLERVTEHVVALLGDGRLSFLGGGVDEYLDRVRAGRGTSGGSPGGEPPRAGPPRPSAAEERTARKELQRLERQLERLSARETELTAQLAANATDYEKLTTLGADLKAAQAEKADLEERWLTVAAELDPRAPSQRAAALSPRAKGPPAPPGLRSDEGATREGGASRSGPSDEGRRRLKGGPEASELKSSVEGGEQDPHQVGQVLAFAGIQARQQRPLAAQQAGQRRVHPRPALAGEGDQHAPLIPGVGLAADEVARRPAGRSGSSWCRR